MPTFIEIIEKKKNNIELNKEEIYFLVNEFVRNNIKDYQMSSFLMATWFNSLTDDELVFLTQAMVDSGDKYKLNNFKDICVDKHSTGGVGDKVSLIFGPILAYLGVAVGKISGRGLAQTGGTIDKLESCKGWTGEISNDEFEKNLNDHKFSLMSQSNSVVPADKLLYALRDVTGTVDSLVLIAASIMSKKFVLPTDYIILDIKVGDGAFMKDENAAQKLAEKIIMLSKRFNRHLGIIMSDMNKPLGKAIGNALEVKEAYDTLNGQGPQDLVELVTCACSLALVLTKKAANINEANAIVLDILKTKKAAIFLEKMITSQGGDFSLIKNYNDNFKTKYSIQIRADKDGYLEYNSAYDMGILSALLGAGRFKKDDILDYGAGIYLNRQTYDRVLKGDIIMTLFTNINNEDEFVSKAKKIISIKPKISHKPIIIKHMTS
ncbi:thymidine phosphorylase [Spiroplasma endosymbiont of Aspidapion aeneum]|uniref:thymidine phosphorylase n=1 Tax=Spiroplasma endosymbiont of Aspidapion aeneum TaxID=3066276 RepID=UPI00313E13FD